MISPPCFDVKIISRPSVAFHTARLAAAQLTVEKRILFIYEDDTIQRYNWPNTFNTRDLGYTQTMDGNCVKPLRFLRSDAPRTVSEEIKSFLLQNNIRTVIDLRSKKIAGADPSGFTSDSRFSCWNFPLATSSGPAASEDDIIESYRRMLENDAAIAGIFGTMANAEGGVLFHCQDGKDRTGIVAALFLLLAGVPDIDIFADYEISNVYFYEMIKTARAVLPEHLLYVRAGYMESVLKYLRGKYKTIENYLLAKGIAETEIKKLKGKLLD